MDRYKPLMEIAFGAFGVVINIIGIWQRHVERIRDLENKVSRIPLMEQEIETLHDLLRQIGGKQ